MQALLCSLRVVRTVASEPTGARTYLCCSSHKVLWHTQAVRPGLGVALLDIYVSHLDDLLPAHRRLSERDHRHNSCLRAHVTSEQERFTVKPSRLKDHF